MEKIYTNYLFGFIICLFLLSTACRENLVTPRHQQGVLVLDNYIALGDGYSAGFSNTSILNPKSNKGLYEQSQLNSFPTLLVNQFNQSQQLAFFNPGLLSKIGSGYLELNELLTPPCPENELTPIIGEIEESTSWYSPIGANNINNLSVPRLQVSHVENPSLNNPFFTRIKSDSGQNYLDIIENSKPSFFTLNLGSRDLLDYAIRGGSDPAYPLLTTDEFSNLYAKVLRAIFISRPEDIRGVVAKIPDISDFPFFTSTNFYWKDETRCNSIKFPLYIETSFGSIRTARDTDRILLSASSTIGQVDNQGKRFGLSSDKPIPKNQVLDSEEVAELKNKLNQYNLRIDSLVQDLNNQYPEDRVAIAKIDVLIKGLTTGLIEDGIDINNRYLSGGFFSLDGLYFTPRGNAMVANEFVRAINETKDFGALFSPLNLISYSGVEFP